MLLRRVLAGLIVLAALALLAACSADPRSPIGRWEGDNAWLEIRRGGRFDAELGVARHRGTWTAQGLDVILVPEQEGGGLLGGRFDARIVDAAMMRFTVSGSPGELVLRRAEVGGTAR